MSPSSNHKKSRTTFSKIRNQNHLYYWVMKSPVGRLLLVGNGLSLIQLSFLDGRHPVKMDPNWTYSKVSLQKPIQQLQEYFSGKRKSFNIKLSPSGTPFQQQVWSALRSIPYGKTVSYGEIAQAIGKPQASRAVGAANGKNPISIIVPCHRVIGSSGKLVGYGGGLPNKATLLTLEKSYKARKP
jgi:methylated-DNA-[protein]-cysteine S-methyltransferase